MPALQKLPARLPRFVPHLDSGTDSGETAGAVSGAGTFLEPAPTQSQPRSESLERLAHDLRNILASLMLSSDLLSASGVLNAEHRHFALELESMTLAATQLTEKILNLALPAPPSAAALPIATPQPLPTVPVTDLAAELNHLTPLLAAIAGPSIQLSVATMPCAGRTSLAVEDLTRILVNLVRNAADAMPCGGHVRIAAQYGEGHSFLDPANTAAFGPPRCVLLSVADNGPGIPAHLRDKVFDFGFTTRNPSPSPAFPAPRRRGLGLSTVQHLVESAGGSVHLSATPTRGACFEISIPLIHPLGESITSGTYLKRNNGTFATDSATEGHLECR